MPPLDWEELTPLQEEFCQQWFICRFNATEAAVAAGISPKAAPTYGSKLLSYPKIQKRIKELDEDRFRAKELSTALFAEQLLHLCSRSIHDYCDEKGRLLKPHELNKRAADCVDGIKQRRIVVGKGKKKKVIYEFEYKLSRKQEALDLLARHKGLIASIKHEIEGKVTHIIDYEKLCQGPNAIPSQTIELDPLEYAIMNPDAELKAPVPNGEKSHLYRLEDMLNGNGENHDET